MPQRTCRTCESPFESTHGRLYCSPPCKSRRRRRTSTPCEWCGHDFHCVKAGQRYCSNQCAAHGRGPKVSAVPWFDCPTCATPFIRRRNQQYCSVECRRPGSAYLTIAGEPFGAECCTCGAVYQTIRSQGRYQCEQCRAAARRQQRRRAKRRRRALLRSARSATYRDQDIFERDGWVCQLCGRRLGSRPVPDNQAPTIDHIVPLSRGGADESSNVQAAHFLCNSRKGAASCGSQLRLLG